MEKRDSTIDIMKGIGIILVILGHAIQNNYVPLNKVILSFHMPLFFFVSGMLFKPVNGGGGV